MSKTFCIQPWISFGVRTYGGMCICPEMKYENESINIAETTPQNFRISPAVTQIRQDMLDGKAVAACKNCKLRDKFNKTQAELSEAIFQNRNLQPQKLTTLRLDLGNHCNLMCLVCGIHGSSMWEKVIRPVVTNQVANMKFDWAQKLQWQQNPYGLLNDVLDLTFSGGEPLIIKETRHILEKIIEMGRASEVRVTYITNGTVSPESFIDLWSHFKEVSILLSIDAIGNCYELTRSPAKWPETEKTLQAYLKLSNRISISISQYVSIFNFFHLREYIDWLENLRKKHPERTITLISRPITNPSYLAISSFSEKQKSVALRWIENQKFSPVNINTEILKSELLLPAAESDLEILFKRKVFSKTISKNLDFDLDKTFSGLTEK